MKYTDKICKYQLELNDLSVAEAFFEDYKALVKKYNCYIDVDYWYEDFEDYCVVCNNHKYVILNKKDNDIEYYANFNDNNYLEEPKAPNKTDKDYLEQALISIKENNKLYDYPKTVKVLIEEEKEKEKQKCGK